MRSGCNHRSGFTILELIIIFTIVCVLLALLIPATIKARSRQRRMQCANNLKFTAIGYRLAGPEDLFPWIANTNLPTPVTISEVMAFYRGMSNEITDPKILICPTDVRRPATNMQSLMHSNISYFTCLEASEVYPQRPLAGDRNLTTNGVLIGPAIVKLNAQSNVAFDVTMHRFSGSVAMGDGSIMHMSSARLRNQLTNSGLSSLRIAVP